MPSLRLFADRYRRRLGKSYRYVLSMPIRLADRQQPKYRMIHATNHPDGCVLMADNMMTRTENLYLHLKGHGQGSLLPQDVEGEVTDPAVVEQQMYAILARGSGFVDAQELMADFYVEHGVICRPQVIREAWGEMEAAGTIEIRRIPSQTKNGVSSRFLTYTTKQKLWIMREHDSHQPMF